MALSMAQDHSGGLTRDHVVWAYRLLLDRDPESEDVIGPKLAGSRTTAELRHHLITSAEFREKNPDFAHTNDPTVVIKEIAPGVRLFVDLSDHVIGLNILRGRYEQDEIGFVRAMLKPGDSAVDVGGHIGFFTMQMAAAVGPEGRVYAFEPLDANADLLERSIAENGFGDRVRSSAPRSAPASGTATLTFPVETLNSGGAYLLRDGGGAARRQPDDGGAARRARRARPAPADPLHQDGRRRRRTAGAPRRGAPPRGRQAGDSFRAASRRSSNARPASPRTSFSPRSRRSAIARTASSTAPSARGSITRRPRRSCRSCWCRCVEDRVRQHPLAGLSAMCYNVLHGSS